MTCWCVERCACSTATRWPIEIATQLKAFVTAFGRAPDFVDGHQHVHLFPQVREPLLEMVKEVAPQAWVRQCGRVSALSRRPLGPQGAAARRAEPHVPARAPPHRASRTNPAFAGTYDFNTASADDFASGFPAFSRDCRPHSVVMCHPGFVDAELKRLDPLTALRESEYAYFADRGFSRHPACERRGAGVIMRDPATG